MLDGLSKRQKNILMLFVGLFIFVSIFIIIYSFNTLNKNQFGVGIKIQNFDSKVKNLPKFQKDSIEAILYRTIDKNVDDLNKLKISDAVIRENSESQGFNDKSKTYTGYFIVDIPSIKQSYQVNYYYPTDEKLVPASHYDATITCPLEQQLLYGDFNCKDDFSNKLSDIDPILEYLPKSSLTYEIKASVDNNKISKLNVHLFLSEADYNTGVNNAINKYKSEVLSFIKATGQDPNNYTIEYTY